MRREFPQSNGPNLEECLTALLPELTQLDHLLTCTKSQADNIRLFTRACEIMLHRIWNQEVVEKSKNLIGLV